MEYNFREIEKKWHDYWIAEKVYKVEKDTNKPKYCRNITAWMNTTVDHGQKAMTDFRI